ncbi:MAG: CopD family protein [bacterium]
MPRTGVRFALTLVVTLAALLGRPGVALAHARLKSSAPANGEVVSIVPALLRLDFTESPELALTSVEIRGADGRLIPLGPLQFAPDSHRAIVAQLRGALAAGGYVVTWQVVGDDGHPVRGTFSFAVSPSAAAGVHLPNTPDTGARPPLGAGAGAPVSTGFGVESSLYVLIRWAEFVGLVLIVGAVGFRWFVLVPISAESASYSAELRESAEQPAAVIGGLAALLLLVDAACRVAAQWLAVRGAATSNAGVMGMVTGSRWGTAWAAQVALAVVAALLFARLRRSRSRGGWTGVSVAALALAFTPSLAGHAMASQYLTSVAVALDGLHVAGASGWLGTLGLVLIVGLPAVGRLPERDRGPALARMVAAFSPVALTCASIVSATGTFAAWHHMRSWTALWQSDYGQALLVKLALVACVALAGAYNWRVVTPRLTSDGAASTLQRAIRIELAFGLLVLVITAVLIALPTPLDMRM